MEAHPSIWEVKTKGSEIQRQSPVYGQSEVSLGNRKLCLKLVLCFKEGKRKEAGGRKEKRRRKGERKEGEKRKEGRREGKRKWKNEGRKEGRRKGGKMNEGTKGRRKREGGRKRKEGGRKET